MEPGITVYLTGVFQHITVPGHTQMFNSCKRPNKMLDSRGMTNYSEQHVFKCKRKNFLDWMQMLDKI